MEPANDLFLSDYNAPLFCDFDGIRRGEDDGTEGDQWFSVHEDYSSNSLPREIKDEPLEHTDLGPPPPPPQNEETTVTDSAPVPVKTEETQSDEGEKEEEEEETMENKEGIKEEEEEMESDGDSKQPTARLGQKRSGAITSLVTPLLLQKKMKRPSSVKAAVTIRDILQSTKHSNKTQTPEHLKRYLKKKERQIKRTREELEEEEMEKMQAETRESLRKHRKTFQQLSTTGKKPVKMAKRHSSKPTTESVEFKFRTERRCRKRRSVAVTNGTTTSRANSSLPPRPPTTTTSFPMSLRSGDQSISVEKEGPRKPTEAKPFNFKLDTRFPKERSKNESRDTVETGSSRGRGGGGDGRKGYVSTAEYIFKFQAGTPERFRHKLPGKDQRSYVTLEDMQQSTSSSTNTSSSSTSTSRTVALGGSTLPYTPKLLTKIRARPTLVKSTMEQEEEELEKIRQNPIKAQPFKLKIVAKNGLLGVPAKTESSSTQAITPKLATKERCEARAADTASEEEDSSDHFKAQPLPKGLFNKVQGLPRKQDVPLTNPVSPAFSLIRRNIHSNKDEDKEDEECHLLVPRPVPDFSKKFEPHLSHKKTEIKPFTFEERDKDKPTRATLVQQILEKDKREQFRANPVPYFNKPTLPPAPVIPPTSSRTPQLRTRTRGMEYETKWKQTLNDIAQRERENMEFRARDAKVLYKSPFRTRTGDQQITEVTNIVLHTEQRSEQRAEFEKECKMKREEMEDMMREKEELEKAKEAKDVAVMRHNMVHKAQPIRHYSNKVILPSSKRLTEPQSPNFTNRVRGIH